MIKKIAAIAALLILISEVANAQVKPFRFGLKLAPGISWISPDSEGYERKSSPAAFSWGFISDITITENYYLGTGFNINYLNGKISFPHSAEIINSNDDTTTQTGSMTSDMKLRYLEVPLTLKMKTSKFDQIQFYGQIGFSAAINIKAKAEQTFSYGQNAASQSETRERDISDDITFMKGSLMLGGGIEYYIDNSTSIVAGITFSNGISNILKGRNTIDPTISQKATPHYMELTLGVIF
jgi:hypothetical protein